MEIKFRDIRYGNLMSQTFPGLLFLFELILAFNLFTPFNGFNLLYEIDYEITNLIAVLTVLYVLSTLFGIILDGITHTIYDKLEEKNTYEIYEVITTYEELQIYIQLVDHDYWYFYKAFANFGIAMLPGIVLMPYWLYQLKIAIWFIFIMAIIYFIIFIIMIRQAWSTHSEMIDVEKALIKNFTSKKAVSPENLSPDKR